MCVECVDTQIVGAGTHELMNLELVSGFLSHLATFGLRAPPPSRERARGTGWTAFATYRKGMRHPRKMQRGKNRMEINRCFRSLVVCAAALHLSADGFLTQSVQVRSSALGGGGY